MQFQRSLSRIPTWGFESSLDLRKTEHVSNTRSQHKELCKIIFIDWSLKCSACYWDKCLTGSFKCISSASKYVQSIFSPTTFCSRLTYKRMSSSSLYGLFLLWFVRVSRQNAFCGALSWLSIVYLCTWAWLDGFTTSQGFVCLSLFSHQRPDIIAFQLWSPFPLLTNVSCGGGWNCRANA